MKPAQRRACRTTAALILVLGQMSLSAHAVIIEQVVEVTIERQGDLVVRLHVPAAVSGDPSLARLLKGSDITALDRQQRIVAADVARNLDLQQREASLPVSSVGATRGSDAESIDVEVRYAVGPDDDELSARLNAFSAKDSPVRTTVRFRPASRQEQFISITGPATRVAFDPPLSGVLPDFAARGVRALFDGGDQLLFLLCLVLPARRTRSLAVLIASALSGQAIIMAASILAPASSVWSSIAAMAAASAIVAAAVQNIAGTRAPWVLPVAATFGALNGWTFGAALGGSVQFAGAHHPAAVLVFVATVLTGELWLGAVAWAFRTWLAERGVADGLLVVVASALIAHSAVHRVMERAELVAQTGSFDGERVLLWLTLIWIGGMLLAAAAKALSSAPERARAS